MLNKLVLSALAVSLTGCTSTLSVPHTHYVTNNEFIILTSELDDGADTCPIYVPLPAFIAPDVPMDRLRQAAATNEKSVVLELTQYIRELREHISARKKDEQTHYQNYVDTCKDQLK